MTVKNFPFSGIFILSVLLKTASTDSVYLRMSSIPKENKLDSNFQLDYDSIQNTTAVNCTPFIPIPIYKTMVSYSNTPMPIPDRYLYNCLAAITYDKDLSAISFYSNYSSSFTSTNDLGEVEFLITISQLLALEFDGKLTLKVNLDQIWQEPRLQWNISASTGIPNWYWSKKVVWPVSKLWIPVFKVLNCPLGDCRLLPRNSSLVSLFRNGYIELITSHQISAICTLNFTYALILKITLKKE